MKQFVTGTALSKTEESTLSSGNCEFKYRAKEAKHTLSCQSQQHPPNVDVCELVYAEEGRQRSSPSL